MEDIVNARIESTSLGDQGRGWSSFLYLNYGDSSQGFGGFRLGGEFTHQWITGILKTLEVENWEELPGTHCRAKIEGAFITKIGHILKDKWFDPKNPVPTP